MPGDRSGDMMPAILTYAVGDIHGSYTKLVNLLEHCLDHCGRNTPRFVFVGDYVDRGRRSRDVVNALIKTQAGSPDQVVCLRGNHEEMLIDAAEGRNEAQWLDNGGDMTLQSYGLRRAAELPAEHLEWLASLPLAVTEEKRLFVHAGILPGVPLQEQPATAVLWIREPFLSDPSDHGLFIVHGHTPLATGVPDLRRNRLNLDTAACFGGPLTAAVFDDKEAGPLAFITDAGTITPAPALTALEQA